MRRIRLSRLLAAACAIAALTAAHTVPAGGIDQAKAGLDALAAGDDAKAVRDAKAMFAVMDANKDGVLTKEEFAAHHMADDFAKADKNGDGKVTRDEYLGHASGAHAMPGM